MTAVLEGRLCGAAEPLGRRPSPSFEPPSAPPRAQGGLLAMALAVGGLACGGQATGASDSDPPEVVVTYLDPATTVAPACDLR